ncbi:MAG TPA: putative porin [Segetibacter sp.]|jgi:hypothetical protein
MNISYRILLSCLLFIAASNYLQAQDIRVLDRSKINSTNAGTQVQTDRNGRVVGATQGSDSLRRRDNTSDSITIYYRYFDSSRNRNLDSAIGNFYNRFPLPAHYVHLGNFGTAARSMMFEPNLKPGWDAGFHGYDIYRFKIENTKFYQTTRPFTELGYMLGSQSEQMVNIIHTQNIKPNFNMAFQYRFINSPGEFRSQNSSHNSFKINGAYQSNNKRYTVYGILLANKLRASEHGGIVNDSALVKEGFNARFDIPTRLGSEASQGRNFFNTTITTGNLYDETVFLLRQQYDLGQKDSIVVNDSTTVKLFYPRVRLQHTFTYTKNRFSFQDLAQYPQKRVQYQQYFRFPITSDTVLFKDLWRDFTNDFSIISFPVKNNPNQFLKVGAAIQNIQGNYDRRTANLYNVILNGEYRNRTRNQKWDLEAAGRFYAAGNNAADYSAQVLLRRFVSKKLGSLEVAFQNVNRTPSFIFSGNTSFPVTALPGLKKENTTRFSGRIDNPDLNLSLAGEYNLISNYTFFTDFFKPQQEATLFNLLHLSAEKKFKLRGRWNLYSEIHLQQTSANAPVNVPFIYTQNRLAFEANLYKNLFLATGVEVRYSTPYKAANYSPFIGQFFLQDTLSIGNRPEINAFFNFRIKSFKAFIRAENLNTLDFSNGFKFTRNNFAAPHYPTNGFSFRLGIWWTFVN